MFMQMLLICTTILPIYGSCMFIVTNYHLWLVVLCERPSFPSFNRMFVEKYHLCELGIRWLHYVTVNVYCCLYNLVYSFSLLYLFCRLSTPFIVHLWPYLSLPIHHLKLITCLLIIGALTGTQGGLLINYPIRI